MPVMTRHYKEDQSTLRDRFGDNYRRILVLLLLMFLALIIFAREGIVILGGVQYLPALSVILPVIIAFVARVLFELWAGGVLLPSHKDWDYLAFFIIVAVTTSSLSWILISIGWGPLGAAVGLALGSWLGVIYVAWRVIGRGDMNMLVRDTVVALFLLFPAVLIYIISPNIYIRLVFFVLISLCTLAISIRLGILPPSVLKKTILIFLYRRKEIVDKL